MECLERQTMTPFSGVKKKSTRLRYSECFRVYTAAAASQKMTKGWLNVKGAMNGTMICVCPFRKSYSLTEQLSGFVLVVG